MVKIKGVHKKAPAKAANVEFSNFNVLGTLPKMEFLVATSSYGLLLFSNKKCTLIDKSTVSFGITKYNEEWWNFSHYKENGYIYSFKINNGKATDFKMRICGAHKSVHQIDFIGKDLFIMDTRFNRISKYNNMCDIKHLISANDFDNAIYPNGRLEVRFGEKLEHMREAKEYAHFNSIFRYKNLTYIVAHNDTYRKGIKSEIYVLDDKYNVINVYPADGGNCHNIYTNGKDELICDSLSGKLKNNKKSVFCTKPKRFIRGLSVSDDYIITGGSNVCMEREKRNDGYGYVYILNRDTFSLVATIKIEKCQVMEIKRADAKEYTLSNTK